MELMENYGDLVLILVLDQGKRMLIRWNLLQILFIILRENNVNLVELFSTGIVRQMEIDVNLVLLNFDNTSQRKNDVNSMKPGKTFD